MTAVVRMTAVARMKPWMTIQVAVIWRKCQCRWQRETV